MQRMLFALRAIFLELQFLLDFFLVARRLIIHSLADVAAQFGYIFL